MDTRAGNAIAGQSGSGSGRAAGYQVSRGGTERHNATDQVPMLTAAELGGEDDEMEFSGVVPMAVGPNGERMNPLDTTLALQDATNSGSGTYGNESAQTNTYGRMVNVMLMREGDITNKAYWDSGIDSCIERAR